MRNKPNFAQLTFHSINGFHPNCSTFWVVAHTDHSILSYHIVIYHISYKMVHQWSFCYF